MKDTLICAFTSYSNNINHKVEHKLIENFNAKALKWMCGNMNYIDSLISTNLLPPLYYKVLKDFLLYSNIINDYYTVDLTEHYEIKREGRQTRIILPTTFYEAQRQTSGTELDSESK